MAADGFVTAMISPRTKNLICAKGHAAADCGPPPPP